MDLASAKVTRLAARSDFVEVVQADGTWSTVSNGHWTAGYTPGVITTTADLLERRGKLAEAEALRRGVLDQARASMDANPTRFDTAHRLRPAQDAWDLLVAAGNIGVSEGYARQKFADHADYRDEFWEPAVGAWQGVWRPKPGQIGVLLDQLNVTSLMLERGVMQGPAGLAELMGRVKSHARLVAEHHVRDDGSTYHWAYFDAASGAFINGETYQGLADESTWARGQAWAMLGFTDLVVTLREHGLNEPAFEAEMLAAARKVSDWFVANLPASGVPLWDFDAPAGDPLDTSAAAVAAFALQRLAGLLDGPPAADAYLASAERILVELAARHLAAPAAEGLLADGSGNVPTGVAVETPLIYGDYYLLQAINLWESTVGR